MIFFYSNYAFCSTHLAATTFSWKFDAAEEDEPEEDVSPDCKVEVRQQTHCVCVRVKFWLI